MFVYHTAGTTLPVRGPAGIYQDMTSGEPYVNVPETISTTKSM